MTSSKFYDRSTVRDRKVSTPKAGLRERVSNQSVCVATPLQPLRRQILETTINFTLRADCESIADKNCPSETSRASYCEAITPIETEGMLQFHAPLASWPLSAGGEALSAHVRIVFGPENDEPLGLRRQLT